MSKCRNVSVRVRISPQTNDKRSAIITEDPNVGTQSIQFLIFRVLLMERFVESGIKGAHLNHQKFMQINPRVTTGTYNCNNNGGFWRI